MTSTHWHEIPFVRICVPFIAGILTQQVMENSMPLIAGLSFTIFLTLLNLINKTSVRRQQFRTGILLALMFTLGTFIRKSAEPSPEEIRQLASFDGIVSGVVRTTEKTDYGFKTNLTIITPSTHDRDIRVMAYIRDRSMNLLPCDTLVFQGGLRQFSSPANPYAFNAGKYYRRQGIHLRRYLDSTEMIASHPYLGGFHLLRKSAEIREEVKAIYKTYVHNDQSSAVLLAMTIGVVDGLDDSIYDAYAKSGAIHVLSISGLHVGIVSVLLFLLIGRVRSSDSMYKKVLRATVLLTGIWAFVFIAGLSPSITRAALMSSIYLTGTIIGRHVKGLNVLAFTAFVCLCINPLQINSLSFQFSYLALCGLLIFFNPMYRLIVTRSWLSKFLWGTIVMSVAAQMLLLPLLIHYFNQISLISVLSSLVAIPASYGILIGGILLLLLHFTFPVVADFVGHVIDIGISIVNNSIIIMSELPMSYLSDVYLPPIEVAILSGTIILIALRILTHRKQCTYAAMFGFAIFGLMHAQALMRTSSSEMLAIYPHEDKVAIDYISERHCFTTFSIDSMPTYRKKEVASFRNTSRARKSQLSLSSPVTPNNVHVLDLPGQGSDSRCYRVAVITDSEFALLNSDLLALQADWIILSSGLSFVMRRAAEDFCVQHRLQFHDLREHGSFYLTKHKNNYSNETQWQNISG